MAEHKEKNEMQENIVARSQLRIENREGNIFISFMADTPEDAGKTHDAIVKVATKHKRSPTPHAPYAEGEKDRTGYQNQEFGHIPKEEANQILQEVKDILESDKI